MSAATTVDSGDQVLPGRGLLGMMLAWLRPAAGVPTSADVPLASDRFDAAQLMRGLLEYERRHHKRLHGAGLVLGLADDLLPPSMGAVARLRGHQGAADSISFNAADYTGDGYQAAMERVYADLEYRESELETLAPRQAAHLANAVCVRAAIQMAVYAMGDPAIVRESGSSLRVEFTPPRGSGLPTRSITVDSNVNAMGVAKSVKDSLDELCGTFFRSVIVEVGEEFNAVVRAGLSKKVASMIRSERLLPSLPAVSRMWRSYQTFSNLRGLYAANTRFVAGLSRPALADALRHSRAGSTLGAYFAHLDPHVATETAAARHLGALAFTMYSRRTLRALWQGHGYKTPEITVNGGLSAPPPRDPSDVAVAMVAELNRALSLPARERLQRLSPQYLAQLVIGTGRVSPLGQDWKFDEHGAMKASRAGRRLAGALNSATDPNLALKGLPWASVLASRQARSLLIDDMPDDDAVRGLRSLIAYANAQRAKGHAAKDVAHNLPHVDDLVAAPLESAAVALERLHGAPRGTAFRAAHRCAIKLLGELLQSEGPIRSTSKHAAGGLTGEVEWQPALIGFNSVLVEHAADDYQWEDPSNPKYPEDFWQRRGLVIALRDKKSGAHWLRHTLDATFEDCGDSPTRLQLNAYEHPTGSLPIVDGARNHCYQRQNLHCLPGTAISSPHSPMSRKYPERVLGAQKEHSEALKALWKSRFAELIRKHPAEMAALLPPVAGYILSGHDSPARPVVRLGADRGVRLARVSMALDNAKGFELVVSRMGNPLATTAGGASLLDVALESTSTPFARAGLLALSQHPALRSDPEALRSMVQNSLGKLVERHPGMLQLAVQYGVSPDSATLAAWDALHPQLKSPEVTAGMTAARMRATIEAAVRTAAQLAAPANEPPAAPSRRRACL